MWLSAALVVASLLLPPRAQAWELARSHVCGNPADQGAHMQTDVIFLDCPAYMDKHGGTRCGLPAEVENRYTLHSSSGMLEAVRIRCPRGHWFNGPVEFVTRCHGHQPVRTARRSRPAS